MGASHLLTPDHHRCDALWARVEQHADAGDLPATRTAFAAFDAAMRGHFDFEERVLFPALEAATGMRGMGPTVVMRTEHEQMRRVLQTMAGALAGADATGVLDHGDTLLMLVQQHNLKEEQVLYPMADARLAGQWPELAAQWPL